MRVSAIGDLIKLWIGVFGWLVVGLCITPSDHDGVMTISERLFTIDFNGMRNVESAFLDDFFNDSWPLARFILAFPLINWLKLDNVGEARRLWGVRIGKNALEASAFQLIHSSRRNSLPTIRKFLMTLKICVLSGYVMGMVRGLCWQADGAPWHRAAIYRTGRSPALAAVANLYISGVVLGMILRRIKISITTVLAVPMFSIITRIVHGFGNKRGIIPQQGGLLIRGFLHLFPTKCQPARRHAWN